MEQRDDKVTDRLKTDVARPDWIAKSSPKWHAHCQNDYTHNLWPANLEKRMSCKCKKGCRKICSCRKKELSSMLVCKGGEDCVHTQDHNLMNAQDCVIKPICVDVKQC